MKRYSITSDVHKKAQHIRPEEKLVEQLKLEGIYTFSKILVKDIDDALNEGKTFSELIEQFAANLDSTLSWLETNDFKAEHIAWPNLCRLLVKRRSDKFNDVTHDRNMQDIERLRNTLLSATVKTVDEYNDTNVEKLVREGA